MPTTQVKLASRQQYVLGEGPVWDPIRQILMWVDVQQGLVLTGQLDEGGTVTEQDRVKFSSTVGAVAPAADGEWIVAVGDRICYRTAAGDIDDGPTVLAPMSNRRLNDGKPDPSGQFVVGSLSLAGQSETEELVIVRGAGHIETIDNDLTLSNGIAWSPDGRTIYSVDTLRSTIYQRDWDPDRGHVGSRRSTFVTLDAGLPDGICVDIEGSVWVAVWELGEVRKYTQAGELDTVVSIPALHVSSVAFAGRDLRTLVVTTATDGLTEQQLADYPLSGHLFTLDVSVRGLAQPLWSGRPNAPDLQH